MSGGGERKPWTDLECAVLDRLLRESPRRSYAEIAAIIGRECKTRERSAKGLQSKVDRLAQQSELEIELADLVERHSTRDTLAPAGPEHLPHADRLLLARWIRAVSPWRAAA